MVRGISSAVAFSIQSVTLRDIFIIPEGEPNCYSAVHSNSLHEIGFCILQADGGTLRYNCVRFNFKLLEKVSLNLLIAGKCTTTHARRYFDNEKYSNIEIGNFVAK